MIADHDQLLSMRTQAENDAFVLVALQRPVAGDLRAIVGTMQNVADVDRMGALALRVAKIARRLPGSALREEVIGYFAEMAHLAVELGNSANDAVLTGAGQIRHENDATDELHGHLFTVLTDPG